MIIDMKGGPFRWYTAHAVAEPINHIIAHLFFKVIDGNNPNNADDSQGDENIKT